MVSHKNLRVQHIGVLTSYHMYVVSEKHILTGLIWFGLKEFLTLET